MSQSVHTGWLLLIAGFLTACPRPEPPEDLEPFVSERLLGDWSGLWMLPGLFQSGGAEMHVNRDEEEWINFEFIVAGGGVADDDDPLSVPLSGQDGHQSMTLSGEADKIGFVTFTIDQNGLISGYAEPASIGTVEFSGWVGGGRFHLDFVLLGIFPGQGELGLNTAGQGTGGLDTGSSDVFAGAVTPGLSSP